MDYLIWNVDPEIFHIGPIAPRWYGLFFALGFVVGYFVLRQIYRNERRQEENLSDLFLYVFLGTLIGARLGHVLFYQPDYYLARQWEIIMIWQGGLSSHGGFTGVLVAIYLYLRKYREMSFLELSDRLVIASLPAASLIRIGNFFNSESSVCRRACPRPSYLPESTIFPDIRQCSTNPSLICWSSLSCTSLTGKPRLSRCLAAFWVLGL